MPGGEREGLEEAASRIAVAAEASTVADTAHNSQEEAAHIAEVAVVVAAGVAGAYAPAGARAGVPGDTSTAEGAVADTANTRWATRKIP